jgi:hypothetical protein
VATGRTFDGVDDSITLSVGNCGSAFGPATVAAIVRRTDQTHETCVIAGFDGAAQDQHSWAFYVDDEGGGVPNQLVLASDNTGPTAGSPAITLTTANSWCLIAVTKATGTVAPRFHKYHYASETWTHENSGSTLANSPTTTNRLQIGIYNTGPTIPWEGDILICGFWNEVLSDGVLETMTETAQSWEDTNPDGLWFLNQDNVATDVIDQTGGGADETGITGTAVGTNDLADFSFEEFFMKGTATLDFGAFPGKSDASVTVTGQTTIVAESLVEAWIRLEATADHTVDEHLVDPPVISAGNIVAGTGFTIYGVARDGISVPNSTSPDHLQKIESPRPYGQWKIAWAWA